MSEALTTITKMVATLPEDLQKEVERHLREYIAELQSEARWEYLFRTTSEQLGKWAEQVRERVRKGEVEDFDFSRL